ncbi:hypothetical protein CLAVI_000483 [Candidatus Clavichlamydia salmonicola]|uniref:hypothetical protein n=1 Tax=Candidatus Clavichlamydia salmonicola TaxID=469812 RepID=UPI0018917047|nr:hypothetical protein [Candidatus Clavichlamydia salmonicola]MBF5050861.1 hypothetical protein [Candidatus Clavichlamydia salmonicola]
MNSIILFYIGCFTVTLLPTTGIFFLPLFFAPYIALCYRKFPSHVTLRKSILCGLISDLFGDVFGTNLILYPLTTLTTSILARHLFEDRFLSFPLISGIFSFIFFINSCIILPFFSIGSTYSLLTKGIKALPEMIFINCIFAILTYTLPYWISNQRPKGSSRSRIP